MFTGIVQEMGTVARILPRPSGRQVLVCAPRAASTARAGDSVSVNGVCLTVTRVKGDTFEFHIGAESAERTTLASLRVGQQLNLEPAALAGSSLGGHFVNGHVDGVAKVVNLRREGETVYLTLLVPSEGAGYVLPRGSIALDGVSLTPTKVEGHRVSVALIPHTLQNTTLGSLRVGQQVNVEFDILAKYAQAAMANEPGLTLAALEENGF